MEANAELQRTLETEGYVTVARAAALLPGVRPRAIYGWVAQKGPDPVKTRRVGGLLFVCKADIERRMGLKGAG